MLQNRNERGATMVEAALAFPIAALLIFGLIDVGSMFRSYLTVRHASNEGARTAIVSGDNAVGDYDVLRSIEKDIAGLDTGALERVVIFKADDYESLPPVACMTTDHGVPDICNVFLPADFERPVTHFGGGETSWNGDQYWPAWQRETSRSVGTDFVGVTVKARASTFFGIFGGDGDEHVQTRVMKMEPSQA